MIALYTQLKKIQIPRKMSIPKGPSLNALVFGASGITGWAIVKTALEYPTPTTFSRVIGLTNRPLSLEDSFLPKDSRLSLKSGIDLSGDIESIVKDLKAIEGIRATTHVYFTGELVGFGKISGRTDEF
jgi:hypothetical protein